MRYALIGCGRIAINHLKAVINNKIEIVAVCDVLPEQMENLLKKLGLETNMNIARYTDYRKLLREINPNLVAIATESGKHARIALDCIDSGCNVIIEKPIALSISDADKIIERAREKGVTVCSCHQNRFNISIQHIKKAMEQGRFGKISHGSVHVRWNRSRDYYVQAPWRGTWEQDGGALMNQSIHGIDLLCWLMGYEIDEVFSYTAQQFHDYHECEDIGIAVIKFRNGPIVTLEGTTNIFPRNLEETLCIFGQTGTVKAGGESANTIEVWRFADIWPEDEYLIQGLHEETSNVYGNGHTALYADVLDALATGRSPYIDAEAGKRALEVVLAVYKSAADGKPVKFPLKECSTMDFFERFTRNQD